MSPLLRKATLTAHVTTSVGWLGAVGGFLALAIAGLCSQDDQVIRAAYLAMNLVTWFVILPLAFASPLTGLMLSAGTTWGLFRHYWVLFKALLTIPSTVLLIVHLQPIGHMSRLAAAMPGNDALRLQIQLIASSAAAIVVLVVATVLSVFKPVGRTPFGGRKLLEERSAR